MILVRSFCIFFVALCSFLSCIKSEESDMLSEAIKNAISPDLSKYDSGKVPCSPRPLNISVNVFIESLRDITSQCVVDFYLRQSWVDCYIADSINYSSTSTTTTPVQLVLQPGDFTGFTFQEQKVWLPDSYFFQVRQADMGLGPMQHFIRVDKYGSVLLSQKVKLVTPCEINVAYFPFDVTQCTVVFTSYGHTDASIVYSWDDNGVMLPGDNLDDNGFHYIYAHLSTRTDVFDVGNFSTIEARLFFERRYNVFFVHVYIPAALIVLLSWIGFYIQRNATPARASIGITTVLTMLTLASESTNKYDKNISNTINAINIYVWVCFAFVILAMVEFALSDYFNKPRYHKKKQRIVKNKEKEKEEKEKENEKADSLLGGVAGDFCIGNQMNPGFVYTNSNSIRQLRTRIPMAAAENGNDSTAPRICLTSGRPAVNALFPAHARRSESQGMAVENEPLNGSAKPPGGEAGGAADRPPRTRKLTLANLAHRMIEARVKEVPRTVDKVSRYLFPIAFLIFNVAYATYYAICIHMYRQHLREKMAQLQ
ncbi:glycine receptor subunit alphaZ1-like [Symsagittifera roscoffensis]|uniref:glycine receptor subunit alphaZ1-like n=1 Tax=Symsagittifera roscoffensis TaxID=84072 RepID=UPI00307BE510